MHYNIKFLEQKLVKFKFVGCFLTFCQCFA